MNGEREDAASRGSRGINIPVSVECPLEPRISEITFDGREIIQRPISKEGKLYQNACKLDFRAIDIKEDNVDELISVSAEEARDRQKSESHGRPDSSTVVWALDSVRNKLRTAYTDISVLHDILSLSKERKYMRLEPMANEPIENRPHFSLHYKKKALQSVANILSSAAERLKRSASDAASQKNENDYHTSLIKLRDHWRLKKQGQYVSGDLSYRTAGSSIKGMGQFEIRQNEEDDAKGIEVVIAGDLGGESCLQVDLLSSEFNGRAVGRAGQLATVDMWDRITSFNNHWHKKLLAAQNTLYCREVFALLSNEAVNLPDQFFNPIVISDEIHYASLLGHSIRVKLVQLLDSELKTRSPRSHSVEARRFEALALTNESRILEHSLALMLLNRMRDSSTSDIPIPVCGPVGLKIYRRKMAIQARDRRVWKQGMAGRSMTSEVLTRATALLMRKRCLKIADELCCPDLSVTVHDTSFCTSWKNVNIRITMTTPGYDSYYRTHCAFNINFGQVNFATKDFVTPLTADEIIDCRVLFLEVVRHHAVVCQFVLKHERFEIVHYSPVHDFYRLHFQPTNPSLATALRYAGVIVARSFDNRWLVKIVCSLRYVCRFYISRISGQQDNDFLVRDQSFPNSQWNFREIDLNRVAGGQTRIRRIALVLSYLMGIPHNVHLDFPKPHAEDVARNSETWTEWGLRDK